MLKVLKRKRGTNGLLLIFLLIGAGLVYFFLAQDGLQNGQSKTPSLAVDTTSIHIANKERHHTFVILNESNGGKTNVTEQSKFITSNKKVAAVDQSGVITAISPGKAKIMIRYKEFTKIVTVTVENKILQVNVKDYGAVGDGRIDDTNAFQNAINDLSQQEGGNVFIPEGTYILQPIFLKPKVNLVGESRDRVSLKLANDAPDGHNRLINMEDNTKIQNITCDGNYRNHPKGTEHMHCIFAYDKDHLLIENSRLKNAFGDGISISGSEKSSNFVVISNNIMEENQRSQIVIEQVNHLKVINNTITSQTGRPGIHFEPWEEKEYFDAKITGNTITTNSTGYCSLLRGADSERAGLGGKGFFFHGIEFYKNTVNCPTGVFLIEDTSGIKFFENKLNVKDIKVWRKNENVNIYKNLVHAEIGVRIEGGWEGNLVSTATKIYGNTFSTSKEGVLIQAGAEETKVVNNTFSGEGNKSGIKLFASNNINDITVCENTFTTYDKGVYFEYYGDVMINGVKVCENRFIDLNNFALYAKGPVHNLSMVENVVTNSSGAYIYVHEGRPMSNITISNNTISGGKDGIVQEEYGKGSLNRFTINDNHISNNSNAAIELKSRASLLKNVSISKNILTNNAKNKIKVPDGLKKFVRNNIIQE
ncbi:right-handed parallel beta-helix repeat-containing protein [Neobacillus sp. K501]